jgi:transcriptional regulator with XRE-family HTH domain
VPPVVTERRVCPGCGAILSRFNKGRRCAACVKSHRTGQATPRPDSVSLGQQISRARTALGLTRYDLACLAGVSVALLRSVEQDDRDTIAVRPLLKLAGALGGTPAELHGSVTTPGTRIRAARHDRGLTLTELGRDCGMSAADLSSLEKGLRVLARVPTAGVVAARLGLSAADLAPWLFAPHLILTGPGEVASLALSATRTATTGTA